MIRLAVLADIHGNLPALQAVMADMARFDIDQVAVAGDSVNWGPFSRQVLEIVTRLGWALIRGNNELYALDYHTGRAPAHWSSFTLPPFLHDQLGDAWVGRLAMLPDTLQLRFRDAPPLRVLHGIPGNHWQAITPATPATQVSDWLAGIGEGAVIAAHSHIAMTRQVAGWQIFNPGSVGVPLDGELSASYMILAGDECGWQLEAHRRVAYNPAPIFAEFERQAFVERCGVTAQLVMDEFRYARLRLAPYIVWKRQTYPTRPDCPALLAEFLALDSFEPYMPEAYRGLVAELNRD